MSGAGEAAVQAAWEGESGCAWHERVSSKWARSQSGGDLNTERFLNLLVKGNAFTIPRASALKHWYLGPIEATLQRSACGAFNSLARLLGPITKRMAAQTSEHKIPDQQHRRHTMDTWLKQGDRRASHYSGLAVSDKLLHWPIVRSPRIAEQLHLPPWLEAANWLEGVLPALKPATFALISSWVTRGWLLVRMYVGRDASL